MQFFDSLRSTRYPQAWGIALAVTILSGVFYIGLGEEFDENRLMAYGVGSVIVLPGGTPHFHWAKSGEYVTQVTAIGPLGLTYVHPGDDPRSKLQPPGTKP